MGEILEFRPAERSVKPSEKLSEPATVIIFPGVRIERKELHRANSYFSPGTSSETCQPKQKSKE